MDNNHYNPINRREFIKRTKNMTVGTGLVFLAGDQLSTYRDTKDNLIQKKEQRKLIALVGSPRKGGNTDTLLTNLLISAEKEGAHTEKIYLIDRNIKPCRMCNHCRSQGRPPCIIDDDFNKIIEKIILADTLVMTTPTYWGNVSGMMKIFMERGYSLLDKEWGNSKIEGKKAALIVCYGAGDAKRQTSPVFHSLDMFCRFCEFRVVERIVAMADKKGEVAENKEAMELAVKLGRELAD